MTRRWVIGVWLWVWLHDMHDMRSPDKDDQEVGHRGVAVGVVA